MPGPGAVIPPFSFVPAFSSGNTSTFKIADKHAHASHVTPSFLTDDEEELQSNIDLVSLV